MTNIEDKDLDNRFIELLKEIEEERKELLKLYEK